MKTSWTQGWTSPEVQLHLPDSMGDHYFGEAQAPKVIEKFDQTRHLDQSCMAPVE
jgi:hypothetical protein